MAEVKQFRLPDVGEGLTEADIITWRVKPGDQVSVNQVIVEIETVKSLVELPCPYDGVVTRVLVPEGQTVEVGTPIIEVDVAAGAAPGGTAEAGASPEAGTPGTEAVSADAGTSAPREPVTVAQGAPTGSSPHAAEDLVPPPPEQAASEPGIHGGPAPKIERQAVLVGYGVKLGTTARRPRKKGAGTGQRSAPVSPQGETGSRGTALEGNGQRVMTRPAAKPPVRKLAKDLGVDLATLTGTGPNGTITREDVQAAAEPPGTPEATGGIAVSRAAAGGEERIPVRGVRKHTAAAVTVSAFTAPHVTEFLQIDMTESMRAVRRLGDVPEFAGLRLSPLLLVAKALLVAVARHPMINSSWVEDSQEIVVKHYVNLGIAATTGRGLLVPNIKDAHTLSLPGLARAIAALTVMAREGKAQPADLAGGTITITNVGVFGVDAGTPILTPGEAAILAVGQVRQAPWVHEGALAVREVTTLSLSFDHRIVDGDLGSAVLRDVGAMLTDPVRMLAWDGTGSLAPGPARQEPVGEPGPAARERVYT